MTPDLVLLSDHSTLKVGRVSGLMEPSRAYFVITTIAYGDFVEESESQSVTRTIF
jgi:hypothetical protein